MTSISATALRKDLYNIIAQANESCTPVAITNTRGKGAVLVGEDEWAAIEETLYLMGVPGMASRSSRGVTLPLRIASMNPSWSGNRVARHLHQTGCKKTLRSLKPPVWMGRPNAHRSRACQSLRHSPSV